MEAPGSRRLRAFLPPLALGVRGRRGEGRGDLRTPGGPRPPQAMVQLDDPLPVEATQVLKLPGQFRRQEQNPVGWEARFATLFTGAFRDESPHSAFHGGTGCWS